ncbi:hypothetical protein EYZ11_007313 [Aspergillus tanneri]|uniref:Uncharacterized protein n=1 Tax=Aspergillus tanneri TaxID=1220188 RepID=A0A4S3JFL1_9EURO|nr:hypothetical protein EYZ11_007313 [Aspergillus tanneri]
MRDIRAKRNDNPLLPTRERRSQGTTTRGVLSPLANIAKLTNDVATIASTNKVLPEQLKHATEEAERRATDFGIREAHERREKLPSAKGDSAGTDRAPRNNYGIDESSAPDGKQYNRKNKSAPGHAIKIFVDMKENATRLSDYQEWLEALPGVRLRGEQWFTVKIDDDIRNCSS